MLWFNSNAPELLPDYNQQPTSVESNKAIIIITMTSTMGTHTASHLKYWKFYQFKDWIISLCWNLYSEYTLTEIFTFFRNLLQSLDSKQPTRGHTQHYHAVFSLSIISCTMVSISNMHYKYTGCCIIYSCSKKVNTKLVFC